MSARDCSTSPHAARDSAGGRTPSGIARHTQTALTRLKPATNKKALRQPSVPPIQAPRGMPSTDATDQPRNTRVIALPRCSGGTKSPTQEAACGVKIAGDMTASTRSSIKVAKSWVSAHRPRSRAYQTIVSASRRLRSQPATTVANTGAPSAIISAAADISCPATGTGMARELLMSLSVPGTTITPVPMTKLPNSRGQRTRGSGAWVITSSGYKVIGSNGWRSA